MAIELCGDCLRMFDVRVAIEEPKRFLLSQHFAIPSVESNWCTPMQDDIMLVWRCPECSLELSPR